MWPPLLLLCPIHAHFFTSSMPKGINLSLRIFPNTGLLETLKSYRSHRVLCTRSQKKKCLPGAEETALWRRACATLQAPKSGSQHPLSSSVTAHPSSSRGSGLCGHPYTCAIYSHICMHYHITENWTFSIKHQRIQL